MRFMSVCRLSVTRMYCDKTGEVKIMQFHYNVAQCLFTSLHAEFDDEIRRGPLDRGAQIRVRWFLTSRCYILETVQDSA